MAYYYRDRLFPTDSELGRQMRRWTEFAVARQPIGVPSLATASATGATTDEPGAVFDEEVKRRVTSQWNNGLRWMHARLVGWFGTRDEPSKH